ncbi:hypothetical protein BZG02_15235 [Labilibaculum filiforme]|uniref:ABC3 transporter permease C-terminal domain-containing protein n=1 Tax=Labilibaculum filiforme TaxID=1940526 RepID=A0A2N3HU05_9BACT|nr:FtsX-like permease family protein [Labilibaculum filiforme]PKQ61542.1 hypothetical protein BZG02_15235 [Labilibaculum filiforme]
MNLFTYIIKSLWFFRKQHFAVFLGTIVSTAVLTGALIIGDSVKYSLHDLVNLRLGKVEYAMATGDRYVRADLAKEIQEDINGNINAVLRVNGMAVQAEKQIRINNIQAYGVDSDFWKFSSAQEIDLKNAEVAVSANLATKMSLKIGDVFLLRMEKGSLIPANAPFVSDEEQNVALRVKVKAIAGDHEMGRFSLKNNQVAPYNVFLSRDYLAKEMELDGRVNLLLLGKTDQTQEQIQECLKKHWQLQDAGLNVRDIKGKNQLELISDRVFIDTPISDEIEKLNMEQQSLLTYFVNRISFGARETPYSFVSSVNGDSSLSNLSNQEISINQWLADDLQANIGDTISLNYFVIGALRALEEKKQSFVVKEILSLESDLLDPSMMPSFPGLSDAGSCNEWEAGVPVDFSKIRPKDEAYWKQYKGTPKAFISSTKAMALWSNKYGKHTAFRFNQKELNQKNLEKDLLSVVNPNLLNMSFVSVRSAGVSAANNMVDFGQLFLSLSFFIIFAGILLTILIYSLNLDSRSQENGILLGLGFNRVNILRIRIYESLVTVVVGGFVGVLGGILYNKLLLKALNSVWTDVVRTNMLEVHLRETTLFTGFAIGLFVAVLCIWGVTRNKLNKTASKQIQNIADDTLGDKRNHISLWIAIITILGSLVLIVYAFVSSLEQNAELLLSAGGLFMIGALALVHRYLQKLSITRSLKTPSLFQLALKNSARNRKRSLASVALLALGTFSVLITGANRKTFYDAENANKSGTGGFYYWMETTMPVLFDLNTTEGQEKLGFWEGDLDTNTQFVQFRALEGDDASCLNLNQVQKPRILGFNPLLLDKKNAFSFAKLTVEVNAEHPWLALNQDLGTDIIPAFADQTVIVWGLKKAVGDTLLYQNEFGKDIKLVLMGGLNNSIFQGNVLISDNQFQKHFPSISGSKILLVDSQGTNGDQFVQKFENNLQDLGVSSMKTSERLTAFYSVENTYLSMFMFLGGLGVIIGTIGLGIVLMRNIMERKKELALLSAIGYQQNSLFKLLFYENLFLLLVGLACGLVAAIIGVLPSLLSPSFQMPVVYIFTLLFGILISGLIWIWIPASYMKKFNIVETLKNE